MKKSRKIKVDGIEYKYFVDTFTVDPGTKGELTMVRCQLYMHDGGIMRYNGFNSLKISNTQIKQAIRDNKFTIKIK